MSHGPRVPRVDCGERRGWRGGGGAAPRLSAKENKEWDLMEEREPRGDLSTGVP